MKKSLVLASIVFILVFAVALVARLVVHTSVSALNLPVLFGALFGSSVLFLAFSDYSRKPRFRAHSVRKPIVRATTSTTASEADAASAWTYTTLSA